MGPIVSLVRLHVLKDLPAHEWFWQAKGFSARHAAVIERDTIVMTAWLAVRRAVDLIVDPQDSASRAWGVRRLHQRAEPREHA
jgi:hypothetical protein